jgi:hypothetical protein
MRKYVALGVGLKKLDLGQILGIVANLGVLLGILLLIYKLAQNRQMMRAQTRTVIADGLQTFLTAVGSDPQIAPVYVRGSLGDARRFGDALSEAERAQYALLVNAAFSYFENVHYQYRNGLYDESEFNAQREAWRRIFSQQGYAEV